MAKRRVFAVDMGHHSVKVAQVVQTRGGLAVTRVGEAELPHDGEGGDDATTRAVKQAMSRAGIRGGDCVVSIPRTRVVLRHLKRLPPNLGEDDFREIVRLQAESELPFDPGTAIFDHFNARDEEGGRAVELFAAKQEEIQERLQPVRESGGKPIAVVPDVLGAAVLARLHQQATGEERRLLILNIGEATSSATIMRGPLLASSRSFPVGIAAFERDPNEAIERFRTELARTVHAYNRDAEDAGPTLFDEVWLWGGGAALSMEGPEGRNVSLAEIIEAQLGVPALVDFAPSGLSDVSAIEDVPRAWARFGVAIGSAAGAVGDMLDVNLIPRAVQEERSQAQTRARVLTYASAVVVISAIVMLGGREIRSRQDRAVRLIEAEIAKYRTERAETARELKLMRGMSQLREPRYRVIDVLRELTALLPDRRKVAVTTLTIEPSGKITIAFEAQSNDAVSEAITMIGRSAWFQDVRPGQITTTEKNKRPIRQFSVTLQLAPDADLLAARRVGTPYEPDEAIAQSGSDTSEADQSERDQLSATSGVGSVEAAMSVGGDRRRRQDRRASRAGMGRPAVDGAFPDSRGSARGSGNVAMSDSDASGVEEETPDESAASDTTTDDEAVDDAVIDEGASDDEAPILAPAGDDAGAKGDGDSPARLRFRGGD